MKKNKETIVATYDEANKGKVFSQIDISSMPIFREEDFFINEDDNRFRLVENL